MPGYLAAVAPWSGAPVGVEERDERFDKGAITALARVDGDAPGAGASQA